jgi:hypothetical protein
MPHVLKGRITGRLCDDCSEPLAGSVLRLLRPDRSARSAAMAVAATKDTFAALDDDAVRARAPRVLAEAAIGPDGRFEVQIDPREGGYDGGPLEIDLHCPDVPGMPPRPQPPKPRTFALTTLQPQWRRTGHGLAAAWEEVLPARLWCGIRALFDMWTICGRVTVCATGGPVGGVTVRAFDRDWLQDDALASAVTAADGRFRIDYPGSAFRKDILGWNVELASGPDLYFRIEGPSGQVLLAEPPARGRDPDRENVGPCFCVNLCVKEAPPVTQAWFTRIGDFHIYSDINHLSDGLTTHAVPQGFPNAHGGPGYAFTGAMKLVGDAPAKVPGGTQPLRYRFLVERLSGPGAPTGLQPLVGNLVAAVNVGTRPVLWDFTGSGATLTSQVIVVAPSGATGTALPTPPAVPPGTPWGPLPPVVLVPDADGWVEVPQDATNGGFSGPLMRFASSEFVTGGPAPGNGAGNAVADPKSGALVRLVFEATAVSGGPPSPVLSNPAPRVRVNNWIEVRELALVQQTGPGQTACSDLSTELGIRYTADHEWMAAWSLSISTPSATPPAFPALPAGTTPRGGIGTTAPIDISTWPACSYTVTLTTRLALTDGETDDGGNSTSVNFCKQ